jgi:TRAP-type mannitol/chloroaromatic compound transport system permease small subunit
MHIIQEKEYRIPIVNLLNNFVRKIAGLAAWLNVVLIGIIIVQVFLRYGLSNGSVTLEELIWHAYAVAFMFGIAYAITSNSHIRVDIFRGMFPPRVRHFVEIVGILFLLMPVLLIILDHSIEWVAGSYKVDEGSSSPQGLPNRWIIKSFLPISFVLMLIATVARLIQEVVLFVHPELERGKEPDNLTMLYKLFSPETHPGGRNNDNQKDT